MLNSTNVKDKWHVLREFYGFERDLRKIKSFGHNEFISAGKEKPAFSDSHHTMKKKKKKKKKKKTHKTKDNLSFQWPLTHNIFKKMGGGQKDMG